MKGIGKVTKIDGNLVTVSLRPSTACCGCGSQTCSSSRSRDVVARNTEGVPLAPGDYAELTMPASRAAISLLRVFGLPILAFVACYAVADHTLAAGEFPRIAAGFGGCIAGVAIAVLLGRRKTQLPEIMRSLPETLEGPTPDNRPAGECAGS